MHPPFSFPLAEKRMRRARWKRKGTESKLAHLCKFGECGSQLFCSEICFLLRGTGGVRISFSLVHCADSHMKPRDANRTPSASLSAAAPPSNSGRGFQRRGPHLRPPSPGEGFQRERVSKGRGPQPSPFVSLGVQGEVETPWCFSSGVWGGFFSRKECAPRPCGGNRPLREQRTM